MHVGGAQGAGKTTILKKYTISPKYPTCVISLSMLLNSMGIEEFDSRWISLNEKQKKFIRKKAVSYIMSLDGYRLVILDSHYVDMTDNVKKSVMPASFRGRVDIHVVIETKDNEILKRRLNDNSRKRVCDIDAIEAESLAEKEEAATIAKEYLKPVYIITNNSIEEATELFADVIDKHILGTGLNMH
ncbi:MAG: ATP-binding protein [Candidatus Pacebacteria bacterium]|nr:ATP-binding protein [Candidatus Paceibacterota bacterium]